MFFRISIRAATALVVVALVQACGGSSGGNPAAPAPTPTPTPEPVGTIEHLVASLPEGSTVEVEPMHARGQQARSLRFGAVVTLQRDLALGLVQAFVRTDARRCMGGGHRLTIPANQPVGAAPLSMSHTGNAAPSCTLPYTTTHVEFVVSDNNTGEQVLAVSFPSVYHFVAEP